MDNKVKLLVIGLGVVAAISLLIAFQLNLKNNALRIRNDAIDQELTKKEQENEELTKKLSDVLSKNRDLLKSYGELETQATGLKDELQVIKERLELAANERDNLIGKVQELISSKQKLSDELGVERQKREEQEKTGQEKPATPSSSAGSEPQEYWAEVLREKANAELEFEQIKAQLTEISYKANEVIKERDALQLELNALVQEKEDLNRRAAYNERLAKALSEDLVREKNDKEAVITQLEKLKDESSMLRSRVKDLDDTKTTLYRKIDSLEQDRSALKRKLEETESTLTERIDEVVKIKSDIERAQENVAVQSPASSRTVELAPIVVRGDQQKPQLTGRIVSIKKEDNFVIIDLGQSQGVRPADTFSVYRNDAFVATIEVLQVRKDISAADIKETVSGKNIEAGDIVKKNN